MLFDKCCIEANQVFFKHEKEEYIFVFVVIFYVFEKGVFLDYYVFSFSLKNQEEYIKNYIQSYTTLLDFSSILLSFKRKKH